MSKTKKTKVDPIKTIDDILAYCKRRGLVYPTADIYGGYAGFFDYGPVGTEIVRNITDWWWHLFVRTRDDVVGLDGSIITHPKVWEVSGHVGEFNDPLVSCRKCKRRHRADNLLESIEEIETLEGLSLEEFDSLISEYQVKCPDCEGELSETVKYNLMFATSVGAVESSDNQSYLRPETAQSIFVNFKSVIDSVRVKLPFGIAQIGKAFRNEISPRNFLFRGREFRQMEIEYFIDELEYDNCPLLSEVVNQEVYVLTREDQEVHMKYDDESKTFALTPKDLKKIPVKPKLLTIGSMVESGIIKGPWQAYWIGLSLKWFLSIGLKLENIRLRQHLEKELSHYSRDTWDVDFKWPFGWKELQGIADRSQYDLTQHGKASKKITVLTGDKRKRIIPYCAAEPSFGLDRIFLALLANGLEKEGDRLVFRLHPKLAAYKVAVFPLVKKDGLAEKAKDVHKELLRRFTSFYDESGAIGRRYRRQDEIGTPYCITIDYQTLKDDTVTIRERDSMDQKRIPIEDIAKTIIKLMK